MTEANDLFAAVLAEPFGMDLRLRYADAIAGVDPDHAELIRLQITQDRLAIAGEPVRDAAVLRRTEEIGWKIVRRIGGKLGGRTDGSLLRRGFAEILIMSGRDFLARGAELAEIVPWRGAILTGVDAAVAADLAASPLLARLAVLDLRDNVLCDDGLKALLASPHLGRVRWLGLDRCRIDQAGAYILGSTARDVLPELRFLSFDENELLLTPFVAAVGGDVSDWAAPLPEIKLRRPRYGEFLNTKFGPFPWLGDTFAHRRPDYTAV